MLAMPSNLLAHHLRVLEAEGLITRTQSEGDKRRSYIRLEPATLDELTPPPLRATGRVVFVCTANSARSQLAAALWRHASPVPAASAGTYPAERIDPGAVAAAERHHLPLRRLRPRTIEDVAAAGDLVITVCDLAHEELGQRADLHWSVPDPARTGTPAAFDATYAELPGGSATSLPGCAPRPEHPTPGATMTRTYHRRDITLDQQVALKHAATRLARDFVGTFGVETIERFLHSSYDQFAGRATVANFLPLLAERFARQRLQALAKVEGLSHDGKPTVLFLCVHNAGRSQMAMGFFTHHAGERAVAWSGGSEPGAQVNPAAIAAMAERGIDISAEYPKPWTDEVVRAADVVITMGCGDACPVFPGKRYEEWTLDDPAGREVADVRPIRDEVERRVLRLLDELGVPAGT
jgi:arsenate reductase